MPTTQKKYSPERISYDVVIVGGAMLGSSVAWFLSSNPDFTGSILVVEKDPTYEFCSTAHTNSCVRQQFSTEINIRISQFTVDFVKNFRDYMGGSPDVPDLTLQSFGYLYLADNDSFADELRARQKVQERCGAGTKIFTPEELKANYGFYNLDDIILCSLNTENEGYFEGSTIFEWWRRSARKQGAEYIANEVISMTKSANGQKIETITLATGEVISCGTVINATGPRAALTAKMAGIDIPVEPRKRYTYIFAAEDNLGRDLPLTIDPSGMHMRQYGQQFMAGSPPDPDPAVDPDDFTEDHSLWEQNVWPMLANRVPQFERIRMTSSWAGHYAFNVFDHNAIIGPHSEISNFLFVNGFSGHGLQQSPAMGRGISELVIYGEYRSLDLSSFSYQRIVNNEHMHEKAVI